MASKALNNPIIRRIATRGYAQAAPAAFLDAKIQTTSMPNKLLVAALDNNAPVARVTVAFKAGSRYEPQTELGLSHVVRSAAGLTTKNASSFILSRKLSQIGATVTASGDREFIYYTLETTQDNLEVALECLNNLVSNPEFRPWELSDNIPRLKYDIAALPPQVRAVDLLHKAAFRRTLGNSLFISPKRFDKVSSESLQHYACSYLTPSRGAVVGIGISQDKAKLLAQSLQLPSGDQGKEEPSAYIGGDVRKEIGGDLAHIAIAVKGAPANSQQSLALAIAAKALGNGPAVKWGSDHSPLASVIGNIGPFAAAGFNVSYLDNGLFGAVLTVPKDEANNATKAVGKLLKNPSLTNDAIAAGKNKLKLEVLSEAEIGSSLAESFAVQALYSGNVVAPGELAKKIDQISANDITQTLKVAAQSKIAMGAVGNLAFVPYSDEL